MNELAPLESESTEMVGAPAPADRFPGIRNRGKKREQRFTFTIRLTLLALVLSLLVVSGLAINGVWFLKSRATGEILSNQFFDLFARTVARRANDMLGPATYLLRQQQIEAQRGLIVVDNIDDLGMRLVERLRARPNLEEIYHASASTGEFVGAWQPMGNTIVLIHSVPDVDDGAFSEWTIYPDGSRAQYRRDLRAGYDARQRVWFKLAVAQPDDSLVWTEPYVFFRTQRPGITAARAWRLAGDGKPRGVFAADFSLDDLANFLTESSRQDGARSFLVTRSGTIVVSSREEPGDPVDAVWPAIEQALPSPLATLRIDRPVGSPGTELEFAL